MSRFAKCHTLRQTAGLRRKYPPEKVAALTGIGAAEIASLAREYATTGPAVIRLGYGVQRSDRGGAAVAAIAMLPALIGSWRRVGGGLQLSTSQAFPVEPGWPGDGGLQEISPLKRQARMLNMTELAKALTEEADPP